MAMYRYCEHCGARNDQAHYSGCTANDPAPAPDNGWLPIDTAPKGQMILLGRFTDKDGEQMVAHFDDEYPNWPWTNGRGDRRFHEWPTHWRLLPDAPRPAAFQTKEF